ncbi:MAG: NAD-dependent epimerase/dehydratase family protein [Gemmatimonadaceae bacterium]
MVLGGTGFIGPFQVRYAVERGHHVTVYNRGKHQADLPASVEHLAGDRAVGDYASLAGKTWDVVIDNSATNPKWVKESTAALKNSAQRYVYVSSTGVYYPYKTRPIDESSPAPTADPPKGDESADYGVAKARSEKEAQSAFPERALIIRPHYIVGPGDTSDRFPYWPQRLARGGEVFVPGKPDDLVQLIDVRDLTEWMIRMAEAGESGVYSAAGPRTPMRWDECLYGMHATLASDVTWRWATDYDFLAKQKIDEIVPWVLLTGDNYGMTYVSTAKAVAKGLTYRPLAVTTADTLAWWNSPAVSPQRREKARFVITASKEVELLAAMKR